MHGQLLIFLGEVPCMLETKPMSMCSGKTGNTTKHIVCAPQLIPQVQAVPAHSTSFLLPSCHLLASKLRALACVHMGVDA